MIYPTINAYFDALVRGKSSFKTLKGLKLKYRDGKNPLFRASSSCVRVLMSCGRDKECVLRLFLSGESSEEMFAKEIQMEYYKEELLVDVSGVMRYFDVVVERRSTLVTRIEAGNAESEMEMRELREMTREGRVPYQKDGLWGFKDEDGEVVVEARYSLVLGFYESRAVVARGELWGLIDKCGREVIEPKYDELSYDNSHYAYVNYLGAMGVVDRSGREIVKCQWDWVAECSQGLFLVRLGDLYGYLSEYGEVVIEPKYLDANSFDENGYAKVSLDGESSYFINTEEKRV